MCVLPTCMSYVPHVYLCTGRDQKRASDPLKLELQMVVSHHTGAGNRSWNRNTGTETSLVTLSLVRDHCGDGACISTQ